MITRGGMFDLQQGAWTEAVAALYSSHRYTGDHFGNSWYWDQRPWPAEPQPITCATTGRWENNASWNVVVGLDRIGDMTADHYFERSSNGGDTWLPVPNAGDSVLPTNLAMTDVAIEDAADPDKLVSVSTLALDPVQGDELPLVAGHVVSDRVCYSNNLRSQTPRWYSFDPAPGEELWNLQLAMKNETVYGLAYNADENTSVVFRASFANELLEDWAAVEMDPLHALPAAIPYDLEAVANHSLLATSAAGLYYSPDDGASWYAATDEIRTPELRKLSVQKTDDGQFKIAAAGWYASYVGTFDTTTWQFDLQEISYDPGVLDLYQNRNQAWGGLSLVESNDFVDFALIDYSNDPNYPNDSAVVVQVDGPDQPPRNVFLGYQDHGTRPYMRMTCGTGRPWIVYDKLGEAGVVCRTATTVPHLDWDSVEIYTDPAGLVHGVLDAASCPRGDYVVTEEAGEALNRVWERRYGESEWSELAQDVYDIGLIAPTGDDRLYMVQHENNHLAYSTDNGTNWTDITPEVMHGDWSSIAVGFDASMPLYAAGKIGDSIGIIYRINVDGTSSELYWENNTIVTIVADPFAHDICWIYTRDVTNAVSGLWCLYFYSEDNAAKTLLWQSADSIRDIQVLPTDEFARVLDVTFMTPHSNAPGTDHTVIKRWQLNIFTPDTPLPASLRGEWLVAGNAALPEGATIIAADWEKVESVQ